MDSNLWKKIGIKKKSSSEQQYPHQSPYGSEGSTFNLVRCLDNLRNYPQNQSIGIFSSNPIKNNRKTNGNSNLKNQQHNKSNYKNLQIQYCNSEPAESEKDHQKMIQKANNIKLLQKKIQAIKNSVNLLKNQYLQLKSILCSQTKKINQNQYATSLNQALMLFISSQVNSANKKKLQVTQTEKCSKCKNSQKLVQLLTRQCWTLEQQLKQNKKILKQLQSVTKDTYNQDSLSLSKDKLIHKMRLIIEQLEQKNTLINKQLISKNTKLIQLETRNEDNLLYFRQQIQEVKKLAERKIQELNNKNDKIQTQLLIMNKKYSQLLSKYQITKQMNMSLELQKSNIQNNSRIYRSTKYLELNEKQSFINKTFSSQLHSLSFLEDKNDDFKSLKTTKSFKLPFPALKIQNSSLYIDKSTQSISHSYQNAFLKLDSLKRQVQRKIKVSKLSEK